MRILLSLFFILFTSISIAQASLTVISIDFPEDITICEDEEQVTINIYNPSPFLLENIELEVQMPPGCSYVMGSINGGNQININDLDTVTFSLNNLPSLSSLQLSFNIHANCNLLDYSTTGAILLANTELSYFANGGNHTDAQESSYFNALKPNLSITTLTNQSYAGDIGDVFERCITITNGGIGALSSFSVEHEHGTGILVNAVNIGNWNSTGNIETIALDASQFTSIGDGDGLFENGETITICETIEVMNCQDVASNYEAGWGCDGNICQYSSISGNVTFPNLIPNVKVTSTASFSSCIGEAKEQMLMIVNDGLGDALDIKLHVFQSTGGNGFTASMRSYIDETNILLTNANGVESTITADSLLINNQTACSPGGLVGGFDVTIPLIEHQDTLYLKWYTYTCCNSTNCGGHFFSDGWRYYGEYTNICNTQYFVPFSAGASYRSLRANLDNNNSPATLVDGDTSEFSFLFTYFGNNLSSSTDGYYKLELDLSPCLAYTGGLQINHNSGDYSWVPSSIEQTGNTVTAYFPNPPPFGMLQAELLFNLTPNCAGCTGTGSSIDMDWYFIPDTSCSSCELLVECESFNTSVSCPDNCDEGIFFKYYNAQRTSYGLPDNDDNGEPDGPLATLDFDKIRTDRAMYGDTITSKYIGTVQALPSYPLWDHCYIESNIINGAYLTIINAEIEVYQNNGNTYAFPITDFQTTITGNDQHLKFDISPQTFFDEGYTPALYSLEDNDSIVFNIQYRVTTNTNGPFKLCTFNNAFYLSKIADPVDAEDKYSCNDFNQNLTILGYYFTSSGNNTYNVESCNLLNITQQYYLSIGPGSNNYAGGNLFKYEYRNWAIADTMEVSIPTGYKYSSAAIVERRTTGTGTSVWSDWVDLTPIDPFSNPLRFVVDTIYLGNGGNILPSDDGFYGRLDVKIEPSCEVLEDTLLPIKHIWKFAPIQQIEDGYSNVISVTHDQALFQKPKLFLQSSLPGINANDKVETWNLSISNLTNFNADHLWIGADPNSGIEIIKIEDVDNNNDTLVNNGEVFQAGFIQGTEIRTFKVYGQYTSCLKDSITIHIGWNCSDGYPDSLTEYPCETEQLTLSLTPQLPTLVVEPQGPSGAIDLCDTVTYLVIGKNVQTGTAYELNMNLNIPEGINILSGSCSMAYPDTSSFIPIPDPTLIGGGEYQWDISMLSSVLDSSGLKGILNDSINKIYITFQIYTDCQYISGSTIGFNFFGEASCGSPTGQEVTLSSQLGITDASPPYNNQILLTSTYVSPCSTSPTLTVKTINHGPAEYGVQDSITVILPEGIHYIPNSYNALNNAPLNLEPDIEEVGGTTYLTWQLNQSIQASDSVIFSIDFEAEPEALDCEVINFEAFTTSTANLNCVSSGSACIINILTGDTILPIYVYKSFLEVLNANSTESLINSDSTLVSLNYQIGNTGENLLPGIPIVIDIYSDSDNDAMLSANDTWIASDTLYDGLIYNDTIDAYIQFATLSSAPCNRIVSISELSNPCTCDPSYVTINSPYFLNAGLDTVSCSGDSITLGSYNINSISYDWSPGIYLSDSTASTPTYTNINNSTQNDSTTYVLETDFGSCSIRDTITIVTFPLPVVSILGNDTNYCINYEADTFHFSPAGGSLNVNFLTHDSILIPANLSPNNYTITYQFTDANTCTSDDTIHFNIHDIPDVNISGILSGYCLSSSSDTAIFSPFGGELITHNLVEDSILAPSVLGIGEHTFIYEYTDSNICTNRDTQVVEVFNLPNLQILNAQAAYCELDPSDTLQGVPLGGSFNGIGMTDSIFSPALSGLGSFEIEYIFTDNNGCADSVQTTIQVHPNPVINFTILEACQTDTTFFVNNSSIASGTIAQWNWNFGNGNVSNDSSAYTIYAIDSTYSTSLLAISDQGCTQTDTQIAMAHSIPYVNFYTEPVCLYDSLSILNLSAINLDNISTYTWNFDNGSTSLEQHPSVLFDQAGSYDITLEAVSDFGCSDSVTQNVIIYPIPQGSFSVDNACLYDPATFSNLSTIAFGSITNSNWNFGDGLFSSSLNAQHQYINEGTYTVTLISTSDFGCLDTTSNPVVIHPVPSSNFSFTNVCLEDSASFIDLSTLSSGSIVNWTYVLGDGNEASNPNSNHQYQFDGDYNVSLITASDSGCFDTLSQVITIYPMPIANFSFEDVCLHDSAHFVDQSLITSGSIISWQWSINSQFITNNTNLSYIFESSNSYSVSYMVTSNFGCMDTLQDTIVIFPIPHPNFTTTEICEEQTLSTTNLTTITGNSNLNFFWNFGDGTPNEIYFEPDHYYEAGGNYSVTLVAVSSIGCHNDTSILVPVHYKPIPNFGYQNICQLGDATQFMDSSYVENAEIAVWNWSFGNGSFSTDQHSQTNYINHGAHQVMLITESSYGCTDSMVQIIDIKAKPKANFSSNFQQICMGDCIAFESTSQAEDSIISYVWDIDNGLSSAFSNAPLLCFDSLGSKDVYLEIETEFGCIDSIRIPHYFDVHPSPIAVFTASPNPVQLTNPVVRFDNQSQGFIGVNWNFGDGNINTTDINPQHIYEDHGEYITELIVVNEYSCYDTTEVTIFVEENLNIFIPNTFTPNLDHKNEIFNIKGFGFVEEDFILSVFNRWGDLLFQTEDPNEGWNGYFHDTKCQMGMYVYEVQVKDKKSKLHYFHGWVLLLE